MVAAVQLSAQSPAPPWEATGGIGAVTIIGVTVAAGSARKTADHIRYRTAIAVDISLRG